MIFLITSLQVTAQKAKNEAAQTAAQLHVTTFPSVLRSLKFLTPPETFAKTFSERFVIHQHSLTIT